MQKKILIILLSFFFYNSFSQQKRNYTVYQYSGKDSLNGHICKIVKFNNKGLKSYEESIDFKKSKLSGITDYIENYFYKDTLLVKIEETFKDSEEKRVSEFKYNSKNQLIKETHKTFQRRLKERHEERDCLIEDDDYEKKARWQTSYEIYYKYNSKGQKIEVYTNDITYSRQKRSLYDYDYEGVISKITSFENNEITTDEFRINFENGNYDYIRLSKNYYNFSDLSRDIGKIRFIFNDEKNLIEHTKPDETGIRGNVKHKYYYNNKRELIKEERYSTENELEITHLYVYE